MPRRGVWLGTFLAVVALAAPACGCSGDGDDERDDEPRATTTTAQPPGDSPEDVKPFVDELLVQLDAVTDEIIRDPALVQAPDSPQVERLRDIYAPDAEGLAGALQAFERDADAGTHAEPVDSDTTIRTETTGDPETVDEDTVTVPICTVMTYRKLDRDGRTLELIAYLAQPGEVRAVRVDGAWRLERVDVFENTICQEPAPA